MRAHTQKQQQLLTHWSDALGTEAIQSHRIILDHLSNTLEPAAQRCFQRSIVLHTPDRLPHKIQLPSGLLAHLSTQLNPPASPQVLERLALELDDSFSNDTLCPSPMH